MLGQNLQNVVGQTMDFYLAKTYKKVLPKTDRIFYDSYVVNILPVDKDNDKSMREVYGMTYAESMMK